MNFALSARNGHIWRKNCLLNHVIKGKIDERIRVTVRRERRRRQLLNVFEEQAGTLN